MTKLKSKFLALAILEHHMFSSWKLKDQTFYQKFDVYEICERLNSLWIDTRKDILDKEVKFNKNFILELNIKIRDKLDIKQDNSFSNIEEWGRFIEDINTTDGTWDVRSWVFSHIYWGQLPCFKISTCWFYYNIFNMKHNLPEEWLVKEKIWAFLESLSSTWPPIYDGQTFYPHEYTKK